MSKRIPPDDEDWSRRWLRRHRIPCEGGQLRAALDALDGAAWQRLKAAWRQHGQRRRDPVLWGVAGALNAGKRLGPVWCRLIAWGVISEENARLLAGWSVRTPVGDLTFYDDAGARFVLTHALGLLIEEARKPTPEEHAAASFLRVLAGQDGNPDTLDERVVTALTTDGAPFDADTVRLALARLREGGEYDRIIRGADEEE
jgi:hypothetical protein